MYEKLLAKFLKKFGLLAKGEIFRMKQINQNETNKSLLTFNYKYEFNITKLPRCLPVIVNKGNVCCTSQNQIAAMTDRP